MAKFKRYDSYKNSGVEWLGEIPSHWEISKLKFIGKIFAGLSDKKGDDFSKEFANDKKPFIPFTNVCNNLKIDKNQMQYVKISPYEMQNKVREKDIIFLMSSETLDDIGKCSIYLEKEQLYLNSFCKGFRPNLFRVNAEFLNYLLQSKTYRNYFNLAGRGFTRINIKQEYIANLLAVLPPKFEQEKIALYLDEKIAKIDTAVSGKEKLIELLKEQKQIIINDAVTKGINKNAKFKKSGVAWIGEIPQHWTITKLKYIGTSIIGLTYNPNNLCGKDEGVLILRSSNIQHGKLILNDNVYIKGYIPKKLFIRENDIVICSRNGSRELIGKCALAKKENEKYSFGAFMTVFRSKLNFYVFQILNSEIFKKQAGKFLTSTINQLTVNNFNSFEIPLPPKDEQEKIVEYIENKISKIDKLINLEQEYIKSLKEYKASLIDSVVTGKIKV